MDFLKFLLFPVGIPLLIVAYCLAATPAIQFVVRKNELSAALGQEQQRRLYPLTEFWLLRILGPLLMAALFCGPWIARWGFPSVGYLSAAAIPFLALVLLYRFFRSLWLLRHPTETSATATRLIKMTAVASGVGLLLVSAMVVFVVSHGDAGS